MLSLYFVVSGLFYRMGAKQSTGSNTPSRVRTFSSSGTHNGAGPHMAVGGSHGAGNRTRARSLGSYSQGAGLHIPLGNGSGPGAVGGSPDSDSSSDEPGSFSHAQGFQGLRNITSSLPVHLIALHGRFWVGKEL